MRFRNRRRLWIACVHATLIALSLLFAFLLRFDFAIPASELRHLYLAVLLALPVKLVIFGAAGLNRGWWKFAGVADLVDLFAGNLVASVAMVPVTLLVIGRNFPRSAFVLDFILCFLLTAAARFAVRIYSETVVRELARSDSKPVLVYGAGAAGVALARDIRSNPALGYEVVGFLDDDPRKRHVVLNSLPVLGCGREAVEIVERSRKRLHAVEEIIIAMPSATGQQVREALAACRAAGVLCKTIPGVAELLTGQVLTSQIRNLSIDDLLGRQSVRLEEDRIRQSIRGATVLVTGGAGSIGSELCRQVARFEPRRLVIFDQAESELYRIDLELRGRFPGLTVNPEIGDIRDPARTRAVLRKYTVDSIFHAAAYKHVPMMEIHICEAVKNNILGTWNLLQAARQNGVPRFLMISSDKAVNPTSIMGVTKRVAEIVVSRPRAEGGPTRFVSVRFGNVLASNGSVVPLFQAQIAAGGPLTVTHPEMRRYFMTVREAAQLVLQASSMGNGSEIFVLDMGEPIRILELARNMIRLSGLVPDQDIEIRFTGLRPGEKLYEELKGRTENLLPTYHEKIRIFQGPSLDLKTIERWIRELETLLEERNESAIALHLAELVPEYQSAPRKIAASAGQVTGAEAVVADRV